MSFKIVKCPRCNFLQVSKGLKTFKCKRCNYSTRMEKLRVYAKVESAYDAQYLAMKLKEKEYREKLFKP